MQRLLTSHMTGLLSYAKIAHVYKDCLRMMFMTQRCEHNMYLSITDLQTSRLSVGVLDLQTARLSYGVLDLQTARLRYGLISSAESQIYIRTFQICRQPDLDIGDKV